MVVFSVMVATGSGLVLTLMLVEDAHPWALDTVTLYVPAVFT